MRCHRPVIGALLVLLASAAMAAEPAPEQRAPSRKDPYEGFNRSVDRFNEALDTAVVRPVAETYRDLVPGLVRTGISNVLGNLGDVWSTVNHVLQGKVTGATLMTMRVASNTVFGLGGLFDPASEMGLERVQEDLGQTLGVWGVPAGPYLVLPVIGASSVRDAVAAPANILAGPSAFVASSGVAWGVTGLQLVSVRAGLLGASQLLDEIALDKYSFVRDAYLSRRQNQVYDGNPPEEPDDEAEADAPSPPEPVPAR